MAGRHSTLSILPGFIEFHAGDYAVHFATSGIFLVLGLLPRSIPTEVDPILKTTRRDF